jgi:hypothetical protein
MLYINPLHSLHLHNNKFRSLCWLRSCEYSHGTRPVLGARFLLIG